MLRRWDRVASSSARRHRHRHCDRNARGHRGNAHLDLLRSLCAVGAARARVAGLDPEIQRGAAGDDCRVLMVPPLSALPAVSSVGSVHESFDFVLPSATACACEDGSSANVITPTMSTNRKASRTHLKNSFAPGWKVAFMMTEPQGCVFERRRARDRGTNLGSDACDGGAHRCWCGSRRRF